MWGIFGCLQVHEMAKYGKKYPYVHLFPNEFIFFASKHAFTYK